MAFPFSFGELGKAFLKNDILSIDIGYTNIKVVHARKKSGNVLKIMNFGIGSTPSGCIKNGVIFNLEGIAENLKKVVAENGMNEKNVKIVISAGSNIISKIIYIPVNQREKIETILKEEIPRQVPVDIQSQKLFYRITGETVIDGIRYYKALITVVPITIIDNYMRLLRLLNFKPMAIEIPFSSVARFFSKGVKIADKNFWPANKVFYDIEQGANAVVDLGSETTNLSVLHNGALEFNRIILSGGKNLDEMIAKSLDIDFLTAERYKRAYGLDNSSGYSDEIKEHISRCIQEHLGEILRNVKRSLEFYVSRCGGHEVQRIFFIGGGSGLKGLKEFSESITEIPAYTVDMMNFNNLEFESNLDSDKIRYLINAVGIAM